MIVLYIFLFLTVLLVFLICVPVVYSVRVTRDETTRVKAWAFYFIFYIAFLYENSTPSYTIRLAGIKLPESRIKKIPYKHKKSKIKSKTQPPLNEWYNTINGGSRMLTSPGLKSIMELLWQWLKKLGYVILPRHMRAEGTFGTGDPYTTGLALGAYEAAVEMFNVREKIRFGGDFNRAVFTLSMDVSGHISLAQVIRPTLWLVLQKPVRSLIKEFLKKS